MAENKNHKFINYDSSNPRPTPQQRQAVSTYIGKYFRNRSAPAQRKNPTRADGHLNTSGLAEQIPQLSGGSDSGSHPHSLISIEGAHGTAFDQKLLFRRSTNKAAKSV
jgi:hypothetical protein